MRSVRTKKSEGSRSGSAQKAAIPELDARARILAAGLEVFSDEGFAGTTTREIAARARVNLGLIKYYFGSKDKLWRAVVDGVFGALAAELGDVAAEAKKGPDAVASLMKTCVRFAGHNPAFIRLMNDECKRKSARMRWLVDRHGRPMYASDRSACWLACAASACCRPFPTFTSTTCSSVRWACSSAKRRSASATPGKIRPPTSA